MASARVALALVLGLSAPAAALAQSTGDATKGEAVFQDRCGGCHVLEGVGQGPSLIGVVGRKAGSAAGFSYTDALKASGLTWTRAELDRFLSGPTALVPGTAMRATVADPDERHDLIAYLAGLKPGAR